MSRENKKQKNIFGEISPEPSCWQVPSDSSAFQGPPIAAKILQNAPGSNPPRGLSTPDMPSNLFSCKFLHCKICLLPLKGRRKGKAFGGLSLGSVSPLTSRGKIQGTTHSFVLDNKLRWYPQITLPKWHWQFRGEAAAASLLPPFHGRWHTVSSGTSVALGNHPWDSRYWEKAPLVLCVLFEERGPLAQLWQRLAKPVWPGWVETAWFWCTEGRDHWWWQLPVPLYWHLYPLARWGRPRSTALALHWIKWHPQPHFPGIWE